MELVNPNAEEKFVSKYRGKEQEMAGKAVKVGEEILKLSKTNVDPSKFSDLILEDVNKLLNFFVTDPTVHSAYVLLDLGVDFWLDPNAASDEAKKIKEAKKALESVTDFEKMAASTNLADRLIAGTVERLGYGESKRQEKVKLAEETLSDENIIKEAYVRVAVGYAITKLMGGYLDAVANQKDSTDPMQKGYVKQNMTQEAIKNIVDEFINKTKGVNEETNKSTEKPREQANKQLTGSNMAVKEVADEGVRTELIEYEERQAAKVMKIINNVKAVSEAAKANAAVMQFVTEAQALLEDQKINLSKGERKALKELVDKVNKTVEDKAKELGMSVEYKTVSPEHLEKTKKHIEALYTKEENTLIQVIEEYHNTIIPILAKHLSLDPNEVNSWIDETLEERKKRYLELAAILKGRVKGEKTEESTTVTGAQFKLP